MLINSRAVWQGVLGEMELSIPASSFSAWFRSTELEIISDNEVVVVAPNIFVKTQLEKRYRQQITECLEKNGLISPTVRFRIKSNKDSKPRLSRDEPKPAAAKEPPTNTPPRIGRKTTPGNLNPRYTFDNFIVGSSNDLAHAACQAVADNPGTKYNPLYLYGGSGLGKTHLMQAVGNEIIRRQPTARVLYTTIETFVNEFVDSIRFKKKGFSDKYRNVDVLIVDDMQFIANKEGKNINEILDILNKKSGVYGMSNGLSSDFRDIEKAAAEGHKRSILALESNAYLTAQKIAGYIATLRRSRCYCICRRSRRKWTRIKKKNL